MKENLKPRSGNLQTEGSMNVPYESGRMEDDVQQRLARLRSQMGVMRDQYLPTGRPSMEESMEGIEEQVPITSSLKSDSILGSPTWPAMSGIPNLEETTKEGNCKPSYSRSLTSNEGNTHQNVHGELAASIRDVVHAKDINSDIPEKRGQINGEESWGDCEDEEGTHNSAKNNQAAEDSLPSTWQRIGNGVGPNTQGDKINFDQFRVSSELGLAALQQTSLASNELQREVPIQSPTWPAMSGIPNLEETTKEGNCKPSYSRSLTSNEGNTHRNVHGELAASIRDVVHAKDINSDIPEKRGQINGEESWGDCEDEEGTHNSAKNNQAAEDSLPSTWQRIGNGVGPNTQGDKINFDQFRVSSELGLAALQQTSLASNELQREVPIQFGSFKACPRHKEQPKKGRVAVWLQRNESHDSKGKEKEQPDQGENKGMAAMIEKRDEPDLHDKNEGWELPKKRHTCRARGDSLGSPKAAEKPLLEAESNGKNLGLSTDVETGSTLCDEGELNQSKEDQVTTNGTDSHEEHCAGKINSWAGVLGRK
ncbi:hypothetical protein FRX31_015595, partial [Thalictrum thalictroides]